MIFFPVFATIQPRRSLDSFSRIAPYHVPSNSHPRHASEISLRSPVFSGYLLSFDILPNSFALTKNSTRLFSSKSELFSKNTRGWGPTFQTRDFFLFAPPTLSPLSATFIDLSASVANKRLTGTLTSLDATLTKNRGVRPAAKKIPATQHQSFMVMSKMAS